MSDQIWDTIRDEAKEQAELEPMLAGFLYATILNHGSLEDALSFLLSSKLENSTLPSASVRDLIDEAYKNDPDIGEAIREDISAVCQRDPACQGYKICICANSCRTCQPYPAYRKWRQA